MSKEIRPMRVQVRPGSAAEKAAYMAAFGGDDAGSWDAEALAGGLKPAPGAKLVYRGGRTVAQMEFQNIYVGGNASWQQADMDSIDRAVTRAMQDNRLNNVMRQYFPAKAIDCAKRPSLVDQGHKPKSFSEKKVQQFVLNLHSSGQIAGSPSCIFNLVLPPGTTLTLDDASSLEGLGGYHGSVDAADGTKVYYSANVYSQFLANGHENGIVAFDKPWKNVVATLYHEMNEFRTDPDVNDAIKHNDNQFCGWLSGGGQEVGDQPILAASANLHLVFQEVSSGPDSSKIPVQFMYSNAALGAEGPIDNPHK